MTNLKIQRAYLASPWSWYLAHPWRAFVDFYKEAFAFVQRGRRGFADCDVWNFNDYLSRVIAGGMRKLVENGWSYPNRGEMDTFEKWKHALESNAKRLENVVHYETVGLLKDKDGKLCENVYREQKKALEFIAKWFNDLWD